MPYKLSDFIDAGIYYDKPVPTSLDLGDVSGGRNRIGNLSASLRKRLATVGGDDRSRVDSGVFKAMLDEGLSPEDALATFMASARGADARDRKNSHFDDYCQRTLREAVSKVKSTTAQSDGIWEEANKVTDAGTAETDEGHAIRLTPYTQIAPEHLDYIWPNYLARKKLHHWAGNSVQGKSPVAIDLIACVTSPTKRPRWPDGTPNKNKPQAVLLLAGEDDHNDTVRPRLAVAKADASLVYDVQCTLRVNDKATEKLVALDRDINALIVQAQTVENLGLIVIDPITNYLGKVPMNKEEKVREILMPLAEAARTLRIAVVTIGHLNRREAGTDPLQRIMGAAAFHGVARFVYLFGPDPEDADQYAHVMVQRRGCGVPALRYKTRAESHKWRGKSSAVIKVVWRGKSKATAESVVDPQTSEQKTQVKEAAKALRDYLARGPKRSKDCESHLKGLGFDLKTLNSTRVRDAAGVEFKRSEGDGGDVFYRWQIKNEAE